MVDGERLGRYAKHLDGRNGKEVLTAILYLNQDWTCAVDSIETPVDERRLCHFGAVTSDELHRLTSLSSGH